MVLGKKVAIFDWEWGRNSASRDGQKRPCKLQRMVMDPIADKCRKCCATSSTEIKYRSSVRLAPVSDVNFFCKTDNLSKIAIYKLYLEVEILDLDINLTTCIREDRIFRR